MKVFSIYDSKAAYFEKPFFLRNRGEALRGWEAGANDPQASISKFPGDYTLFEIGEYDDQTGNITMYESKVNLGLASQFVK